MMVYASSSVVRRIRLVLLRRLLPVLRRGSGVAEQKRAQGAIFEAQIDRDRVLDGKAACRVRRECLHGDDLAGQRAQVADLVDHVDQDRPAARLSAPRVGTVVIAFGIGFIEHRAADHANERPENSGSHDLHRRVHDRTVKAMMADQQRNACALGRFGEPQSFGIRVCDRLLHERRYACRHAQEPLLDVQHVGRRDDHAVRTILRQQLRDRRIKSHARPLPRPLPPSAKRRRSKRAPHSGSSGSPRCGEAR